MRKIRSMCLALILLGIFPASSVWAGRGHGHHHHGHHRHHGGGYGLALGMGLLGYGLGYYGGRTPSYGYAPNYGYTPNYGYAPAVAVPAAPPVYIQQQPQIIQVQPQPQAQASNYWHYCRNPEGYYPYIKNCPDGWLQVAPQPAQ